MKNAMFLRALTAACVLALFAPPGEAGENEPTNYNNAIAGFNRKLNMAGRKLGEALRPALMSQAVDLETLRKEYRATLDALKEVKKDVAALKVPDSDSARRLAKTYEKFLKGQEQMMKKDMKDIMQEIEKVNPPDAAGLERLRGKLFGIAGREQADLKELQEAQRIFAREHGITLQPANP